MTQGFNEWFSIYQPSLDTSEIEAEFIYEAGATSRQSDIDDLKETIKSLNKNIEALHFENERLQKQYQMMFECVQGRQKTINDLRKRSNTVVEMKNKRNINLDVESLCMILVLVCVISCIVAVSVGL